MLLDLNKTELFVFFLVGLGDRSNFRYAHRAFGLKADITRDSEDEVDRAHAKLEWEGLIYRTRTKNIGHPTWFKKIQSNWGLTQKGQRLYRLYEQKNAFPW